jgi:hypothetical protein
MANVLADRRPLGHRPPCSAKLSTHSQTLACDGLVPRLDGITARHNMRLRPATALQKFIKEASFTAGAGALVGKYMPEMAG